MFMATATTTTRGAIATRFLHEGGTVAFFALAVAAVVVRAVRGFSGESSLLELSSSLSVKSEQLSEPLGLLPPSSPSGTGSGSRRFWRLCLRFPLTVPAVPAVPVIHFGIAS